MVYLVKPNYPSMYLDSQKRALHAVAWGASLGPKYYYGNKKETIWAQEIHKKAVNTQENMYLLQIEKGTHKSVPLYEKVYGKMMEPEKVDYQKEPKRRAKGRFAGTFHRHMSKKEQQLHNTVNTATDITELLTREMGAVRESLFDASDALDELEMAQFGRTYNSSTRSRRPQSAMGRSGRSSKRFIGDTNRSTKSRPRSAMLRSGCE